MKGVLLAGGTGSRLFPITMGISKQLLPVYDKPLIYYPLSVLMLAGIREILLVTTPHEQDNFRRVLGDGQQLGIELSYATQPKPEGIAQAFVIGKKFIGSSRVALALGDNIFYGHGLQHYLRAATEQKHGATVFGYRVNDPERYGVVVFDKEGRVVGLEEKPQAPCSSIAVTGLYFYDNQIVDIAGALKPSARGEIEITDANRAYLEQGSLHVQRLGRGIAWLDTGTHDALFHASSFIEAIQKRQGLMVACLEEIAFRMGYIGVGQVLSAAQRFTNSPYGEYLVKLCDEIEGDMR